LKLKESSNYNSIFQYLDAEIYIELMQESNNSTIQPLNYYNVDIVIIK
jgi:hypothetical protein